MKTKDIKIILTAVKDENFDELCEIFPNGIQHRIDKYTTPEDFELHGDYEADARFILPARRKMLNLGVAYVLELLDEVYDGNA